MAQWKCLANLAGARIKRKFRVFENDLSDFATRLKRTSVNLTSTIKEKASPVVTSIKMTIRKEGPHLVANIKKSTTDMVRKIQKKHTLAKVVASIKRTTNKAVTAVKKSINNITDVFTKEANNHQADILGLGESDSDATADDKDFDFSDASFNVQKESTILSPLSN